ncbi:MAG: hypothetical protein ACFFDS_08015 [Candidatus Thorarchaeota archaeon]
MVYNPISLRDKEFAKFKARQAGSQAVVSVNNNNLVKAYEFPIGSLTAANTGGAISGGNFESYTHYPLNGLLYAIEYQHGNFIAGGSIFLKTSGAVETQVWGTITRDTSTDFTVFPRGSLVTTTDVDLSASGLYGLIPMSGIFHLIGSDLGKSKSGAAFRIGYI